MLLLSGRSDCSAEVFAVYLLRYFDSIKKKKYLIQDGGGTDCMRAHAFR